VEILEASMMEGLQIVQSPFLGLVLLSDKLDKCMPQV
jgi:hypothetical protein